MPAERIKSVLHQIIHKDQRGGVDGRYIGENITLIEDVLYEIENDNSDAVVLMLDMEKAFDRVEWGWLFNVLNHFNFGEGFISWLMTIYRHAQCSIVTNGHQSEYFCISRGIRQGDSLSALLFIIQAEPLAQLIRTDENIEGYKIQDNHMNVHIKGCQYVDDTITVLKNKLFVPYFLDIVNKYESVSGAKLNIKKTVGLVTQQNLIDLSMGIQMTVGPEKLLGVPVGNLGQRREFWYALVKKLKSRVEVWKTSELTWEGKCYLIISIGMAQMAYAMEMKTIPETCISEINKIFDDFLWKNGKRNIKRDICVLPRHLGGLGLLDVSIMAKVKKIMWIIRYLKAEQDENWVILATKYLKCLDLNVHLGSLKVYDSSDSLKSKNIPQFYKDCVLSFQELCRKARVRNKDDIIWFNNMLNFNGKPMILGHWAKTGILTIQDLMKNGSIDEGGIHQKLTHKAGLFFELSKIKASLPEAWKDLSMENYERQIYNQRGMLEMEFKIPNAGTKSLSDLTSGDVYNILLLNRKTELKSKEYWNRKFINMNIDWEDWFSQNFVNRYIPRKCKDFNWKVFHGHVNTETRLLKMKFSDGICKLCHTGDENLTT